MPKSQLSFNYLNQSENFELCGLPYLVLVKKIELFIPWCLESRVNTKSRKAAKWNSRGKISRVTKMTMPLSPYEDLGAAAKTPIKSDAEGRSRVGLPAQWDRLGWMTVCSTAELLWVVALYGGVDTGFYVSILLWAQLKCLCRMRVLMAYQYSP